METAAATESAHSERADPGQSRDPRREQPSHDVNRRVAIIGAGAVGSALGLALDKAGYSVEAVVSRTTSSAQALGARVGARVTGTAVAYLPQVPLVWCCVPDDEIRHVAAELATLEKAKRPSIVAHTSGALPAGELSPLDEHGVNLLSFHPMQTLPAGATAEAFRDAVITVEGSARAVQIGGRVAADIGAKPVRIAAEAKVLYHLSGVLLSNGLVGLFALAQELLQEAGISESESHQMLQPLLMETAENLKSGRAADVLTGPAERGDLQTLLRHSSALAESRPDLLDLYHALTYHLTALSHDDPSVARTTRARLRNALVNGEQL